MSDALTPAEHVAALLDLPLSTVQAAFREHGMMLEITVVGPDARCPHPGCPHPVPVGAFDCGQHDPATVADRVPGEPQ